MTICTAVSIGVFELFYREWLAIKIFREKGQKLIKIHNRRVQIRIKTTLKPKIRE